MKVFISWSGERSRDIAGALKQWITMLDPALEPWVASDELNAGALWNEEIRRALEQARVGIICLTPENKNSPWLHYEAGVLSHTLSQRKVYLYLVELEPSEISGPLAQFQAMRADKDGTWALVSGLITATENEASRTRSLQSKFEELWSGFSRSLHEEESSQREHVAIVFTDVVGSSRLRDLPKMDIIREYYSRAEDTRRLTGGQTMKIAGDSILIAFDDVQKAFTFATDFQRSLKDRPILTGEAPLAVRIGIHSGTVQHVRASYGPELIGAAITVAARLTALAEPGEIVVSEEVRAALSTESRALLDKSQSVVLKHGISMEISRMHIGSTQAA